MKEMREGFQNYSVIIKCFTRQDLNILLFRNLQCCHPLPSTCKDLTYLKET